MDRINKRKRPLAVVAHEQGQRSTDPALRKRFDNALAPKPGSKGRAPVPRPTRESRHQQIAPSSASMSHNGYSDMRMS